MKSELQINQAILEVEKKLNQYKNDFLKYRDNDDNIRADYSWEKVCTTNLLLSSLRWAISDKDVSFIGNLGNAIEYD